MRIIHTVFGKIAANGPDQGMDFVLDGEQVVEVSVIGNKLWINIDGQCVVRISKAKEIVFTGDTELPVDEAQTPYRTEL